MMNIRQRINSQKGFTLIELMVVIAVLGILAAMVLPRLAGTNDAARDGRLIADLRTVDGAMNMYYAQNKTFVGADIGTLVGMNLLNSTPDNIAIGNQTVNTYVATGTKTSGATIRSPGSDGYNPATDK
jgi:type II secretion system protein G